MGNFFFFSLRLEDCVVPLCPVVVGFPPPPPKSFQSEVALANQKLVRSLDKGTVHTPHEWSCGAFSPSVKTLGSLRGI